MSVKYYSLLLLMHRSKNFILTLCLLFFYWNCSARFVNNTELKKLKEKFNGVYQIIQATDIGNNKKAKVGEKVKLYFISTSESIKVYAYLHEKNREDVVGNNILYLFKDDFPNEQKWDVTFFEEKLLKIVKKTK